MRSPDQQARIDPVRRRRRRPERSRRPAATGWPTSCAAPSPRSRGPALDAVGAVPPSDLFNALAFCWGRWSQMVQDTQPALHSLAEATGASARGYAGGRDPADRAETGGALTWATPLLLPPEVNESLTRLRTTDAAQLRRAAAALEATARDRRHRSARGLDGVTARRGPTWHGPAADAFQATRPRCAAGWRRSTPRWSASPGPCAPTPRRPTTRGAEADRGLDLAAPCRPTALGSTASPWTDDAAATHRRPAAAAPGGRDVPGLRARDPRGRCGRSVSRRRTASRCPSCHRRPRSPGGRRR